MSLDTRLLNILRAYAYGHLYARSTEWLCACLGCTRRELQKARERLEEEHEVLSDQEGYWFASGPEEYQPVLDHDRAELKADARRIAKRKRVMQRRWPFWQEQLFQIDEVA